MWIQLCLQTAAGYTRLYGPILFLGGYHDVSFIAMIHIASTNSGLWCFEYFSCFKWVCSLSRFMKNVNHVPKWIMRWLSGYQHWLTEPCSKLLIATLCLAKCLWSCSWAFQLRPGRDQRLPFGRYRYAVQFSHPRTKALLAHYVFWWGTHLVGNGIDDSNVLILCFHLHKHLNISRKPGKSSPAVQCMCLEPGSTPCKWHKQQPGDRKSCETQWLSMDDTLPGRWTAT